MLALLHTREQQMRSVTIMTMSMAMYVCFMRYAVTECRELRSLGGTLAARLTWPEP